MEFELIYHDESKTITSDDGISFEVKKEISRLNIKRKKVTILSLLLRDLYRRKMTILSYSTSKCRKNIQIRRTYGWKQL